MFFLEFREDKDELEFLEEVNLSKKPLELDLLIIRKNHRKELTNRIGSIFRRYNIIEYKSPDDILNMDTFLKATGYACLYEAQNSNSKVNDITVSMVRNRYPRKLLQMLKENGFQVERRYPGIYYITDKVPFPTQIVVVSELEEQDKIWLQALNSELSQETFTDLINRWGALSEDEDKELANAVMEVTARANVEQLEQWKGGAASMMTETLRKIMEPEFTAAIEQGMAQGIQDGRKEGEEFKLISLVSKKIKKGKDTNTIAEELEEEPEVVAQICEAAKGCEPDYDVKTIYEKLKKMCACL